MNIFKRIWHWIITETDMKKKVPEYPPEELPTDFKANCTVHHTVTNTDNTDGVTLVITYVPKKVKWEVKGAIFSLMKDVDREWAFYRLYKKQQRIQF
jgi:hypothetical protein